MLDYAAQNCICNVYTNATRESSAGTMTALTKKEKSKLPKKDGQLVLRLDKADRDEFVELCKKLDTSAAREIRHFMRDFVKKNK
ncbi:MAG: hypothetical protein BM562_14580 [Alphaproteobacteria bacterium MedPE-SWcel]|nr:MAG: hypothetical protein BM562_14580 [Alphaproteobacteria bacterium MedPE-SWcel]